MEEVNSVIVEGEIQNLQDIGRYFLFNIKSFKSEKTVIVPCCVPSGYAREKGIKNRHKCKAYGHLDELNGGLGLHCMRLTMRGQING